MMKINYKIIATSIFIFGTLVSGSLSVTRENDEMTLLMPAENEVVVGPVNVEWRVIDSDQTSIPVQLDVFSLSCSNNGDYYATVTDNAGSYVNLGANLFSYQWDTMNQLKNKAGIDDGSYCLRVCATLLRDKNYYYSLCDTRTISVENNNRKPQILSTPDKLDFIKGEEFAYQINAVDPDGDPLTFSLVSGPTFITVNPTSGLVTSTGKMTTNGSYVIRLRVMDNKAAYTEQIFTININDSSNQYNLKIVSPTLNYVYKTDNADIQWTISNINSITGFIGYYSKDAISWTKIGQAAAAERHLLWDIFGISGGDYYIKIEATKSGGGSTSAVSGKFSIDKSGGSIPLITSVKPIEDSVITEKRPEISATFVLNEGRVINKVQTLMALDDGLVSGCTKTDNSITCSPSEDLPTGAHKAKVVVIDDMNKSNTKEWFFTVSNGNTDNTGGGVTIDPALLTNIMIAVCSGLGILGFILVVYILIKRSRKKSGEDEFNNEGQIQIGDNFIPGNQQPGNQFPAATPAAEPSYGYTPALTYDINQPGAETAANTNPIQNNDVQTIEMPSTYTTDEIPDWLKATDSDKPVSISSAGQIEEYKTDEPANVMDAASQPHE